jgi:hypothetical protein
MSIEAAQHMTRRWSHIRTILHRHPVPKTIWRYVRELLLGPQPFMSHDEIKLIAELLHPTHVMLEWGCGGSTLYFSRYVQRYYSIEHDEQWYRKIERSVRRHKRTNVQLMLVRPTLPLTDPPNYARTAKERYAQFKDYIEQVDQLGVTSVDRVLIDGRSRPECAIRVLPYLHADSRVCIHDFFNTRYDPEDYQQLVEQHYEIVDAITGGQSLVVLRPKAPPA